MSVTYYRGFTIDFSPDERRHYVYDGSRFVGSTGSTLQSAYDLVNSQHCTPLDEKFAAARAWLDRGRFAFVPHRRGIPTLYPPRRA